MQTAVPFFETEVRSRHLQKGVDDLSEDRIIKGMVGRPMEDRYPKREHNVSKDVMLEVKNWTVHHPLYPEKNCRRQYFLLKYIKVRLLVSQDCGVQAVQSWQCPFSVRAMAVQLPENCI